MVTVRFHDICGTARRFGVDGRLTIGKIVPLVLHLVIDGFHDQFLRNHIYIGELILKICSHPRHQNLVSIILYLGFVKGQSVYKYITRKSRILISTHLKP